ncbi:hypothetical protein [Sulfitobacter sp. SK011]|uniref:hypothetical protein n=1 Tax=Sulfitobacter sp. SK011 TaxID=1389004 RepID=UPI000E0C1C22|nr:hypothetical protein [Sulfitobacter sp. SK011]AXI43166.1 hypothetical protein C1J02_15390 [Sulfitobacter sp. SK011]
MVDKPSTQVSVIALDHGHVEDQPVHKGMRISLSDQTALRLISECAVELDPVQEFPPFSLIEGLSDLLHQVDLIGPSVTEPKLLEKTQSKLLDGGRLNSLVEECEIRWFDTDLVPHVWNVLLCKSRRTVNIFAQLEAILRNLKNTSPSKCARERYSNEDRRELGLLPAHGPTQPGLPYHYRMIGPEWVRFGEELERLKHSQNAFTQKCLREGRILVFCPDHGITPPARWQREPYQYILNDRYSFVFAADLPKTWFAAAGGPLDKGARKASRDALRWLEECYASRSDRESIQKKDWFLQEMVKNFGLSKNAAKMVWKDANIPDMKKSGRRNY